MASEDDDSHESSARIREFICEFVPDGATVLVAGDHGDDVLKVPGRNAFHFPMLADGSYAGDSAGSLSLIAHLEALRVGGAAYLVIAEPNVRWLRNLSHFRRHLERHYRIVVNRGDGSMVCALQQRSAPISETLFAIIENIATDFQSWSSRSPAILDWSTGTELAHRFPQLAVFSPVVPDAILPYLDRTIDVVVIASKDAVVVSEARRVAAAAVVHVHEEPKAPEPEGVTEDSSMSVDVEWQQSTVPPLPRVSIIVAAGKTSPERDSLLSGLAATLPVDFQGEILAVVPDVQSEDLSSTDGAPGDASHLRMVVTADSLDVAAAWNMGARCASGEFFVFVSYHALPLPGWFPFLLRTFDDYPSAGVVGGKVISPNGALAEAGNDTAGGVDQIPVRHEIGEVDHPACNYVRPVEYASATFLATRAVLFSELSGFTVDASEDAGLDFCRRASKLGWTTYYQPKIATVYPVGIPSNSLPDLVGVAH